MKYKVVEKFISINGEGTNAGKLAAFIRMAGCNLRCSFCDTMWANEEEVSYMEETAEDIRRYIEKEEVRFVTLTGGEPLYREGVCELLGTLLEIPKLTIEIETNGSMSLLEVHQFRETKNAVDRILFTMDYKLPGSEMEKYMNLENFEYLRQQDTVKFVTGSKEDLERMKDIVKKYQLGKHCNIYISPVFGKIKPEEMVEYMINEKLNDVTMQLQMHKFIWDPDKRGV